MNEEKVTTINGSNEKLVGIKTTPKQEQEKYKTVILAHGFGVTKEERTHAHGVIKDWDGLFDVLAKTLAENNYLVYRFDFSGCGESEGDYSETSITKLSEDLEKILEFVRTQPQVDTNHIGLLSQSLGVPVTLALKPKVQSLILTSGIYDVYLRQSTAFEKFDPHGISKRLKPDGRWIEIGPQYWTDLKTNTPELLLNNITKITCPILIINGSKDDNFFMEQSQEMYKTANEPKEYVKIEGAEHGYESKREELLKIVKDWFNKTL